MKPLPLVDSMQTISFRLCCRIDVMKYFWGCCTSARWCARNTITNPSELRIQGDLNRLAEVLITVKHTYMQTNNGVMHVVMCTQVASHQTHHVREFNQS